MAAPSSELFSELVAAVEEARQANIAHRWSAAAEAGRRILSAGSKLHARWHALSALEDDAHFVAEVDRALARERKGRPEAVEGDQPLPFPPAPRKRGGGRGKGN